MQTLKLRYVTVRRAEDVTRFVAAMALQGFNVSRIDAAAAWEAYAETSFRHGWPVADFHSDKALYDVLLTYFDTGESKSASRQYTQYHQSLLVMRGDYRSTARSTVGTQSEAVQTAKAIVINAPRYFADEGFLTWLNNGKAKFTWHTASRPANEWSDVIVLVDPGLCGDGSDNDMPAWIWAEIVETCREEIGASQGAECHYTVRLTNLAV